MKANHAITQIGAHSREREALMLPLMERMTQAFTTLLADATLEVLQRASAAPTGAGSVAELMSNLPEASPRLAATDPEAAAVARAATVKRDLLESIPSYSTNEVAAILSMSAEGVRKRRTLKKLLAVPYAGDWRFPAWQFVNAGCGEGGSTLPGLEAVLAALPIQNPWIRLDLMMAQDPGSGGLSAADLLRSGSSDLALDIVAGYGEHGA
ncbi:MAG: hypothetical protein ACR2GG_05385 [Gemmatimonadaceae bacterium]